MSVVANAQRREKVIPMRSIPTAIMVLAFIFVAGLGYIGGTYNNQLVSAIAPLFGAKIYTGELDLSSVQETYQTLKANYDGELDDEALIEGANRGLVDAAGDEYTVYFNAEESDTFNDDLSGAIGGGIGVEVNIRNELPTVVRVLADNPAADAGILAGDVIATVNDEDARDLTVDELVAKIRGDIGTTVKLGVIRNNAPREFTITRAEVSNPSVYSTVENGIGILTITRFDERTGSLARQAAQSLKDQNVTAVIVDLRGNGGGYLTAAQDVAGIWLDREIVVTEKTNGRVIDQLYSSSNPILDGVRTIVLVDEFTASASEIVAGALEEYGAAELLGEQTFGKGSVQQLIELPDGAQLKVTVARWFTPKGKNISETGITPGTVVERSTDDINAGRDPQLTAAKEALR